MTLTHLDLDRIEGLAGRLGIAARDSRTFRQAMIGLGYEPRKGILLIADILDEAASDLTALITRIRELEAALTEIADYDGTFPASSMQAIARTALQRKTS